MNYLGQFKRKEGFRLTFNKPILASFTILEIQGENVEAKTTGSFYISDMSLKGAKIISTHQFHTPNTLIKMECVITDQQLEIVGELIWGKQGYKEYLYGMLFNPQAYSKQKLLEELKKYVIKNKSSNKNGG